MMTPNLIDENSIKDKYDYDVLFIHPPYLTETPPLAFFRDESFKFSIISSGILSIASYLKSKGFSVKIIDTSVDHNYSKIEKELQNKTPKIIGISNNTAFDYIESLKCLEITRKNSPSSLIVMGGEHCTYLGDTVFKETNNLDILVHGEGEITMELLLTKDKKDYSSIKGISFMKEDGELHIAREFSDRLKELPKLDYSLYPEISQFTPYIEESRGCPKKCKFCLNENLYGCKVTFKPMSLFSEELDQIVNLWGKNITLALLTSNFGMSPKIATEQIKILKEKNITWSTQTSVDSNWEIFLPEAYNAGLRVLTVGFESGSIEILKRINKSADPKYYIARAEKLIREIAKYPELVVKFNIIFYIGETPDTLRETLDFLLKNQDYIGTIIYTPLFITPGSEVYNNFELYAITYGAELLKDEYWSKRHLFPCNPSKHHNFENVVHYCRMIEYIFSDKAATIKAESHHYLIKDKESITES
ncbi:MAG: cobalamin-dependent protein [Nanoarchaeota archaeon]|nr:cobalamin-dependent protein [Nanoarchaeota archaeon]